MNAETYRRKIKRAGLAAYWLRKELARYADRIPSGGLVLDIGSGDSPYRDLWRGARHWAIDLLNPEADIHGSILWLPVPAETADVVVCTEVLEHVYETQRALAELRRILKPGAPLLLSTPLVMGRHEDCDYFRFTPECLERLLGAAGFGRIEIHSRGGLFSSLGLLLTHIPEQLRPRRDSSRRPAQPNETVGLLQTIWFPVAMLLQAFLRLLAFLDRLDARRDFTLGYVAFGVRKP